MLEQSSTILGPVLKYLLISEWYGWSLWRRLSNISKDSNGNKTVNSVETGAQTVNGLEVAAVVVAVTVAPVVALPALALA